MITAVWPNTLMERETKKEKDSPEADLNLTNAHHQQNMHQISLSQGAINQQQTQAATQFPHHSQPTMNLNMMPNFAQPLFDDMSFQFLENQYGANSLFRRASQNSFTMPKRHRTSASGTPGFIGGYEEDNPFLHAEYAYPMQFQMNNPNYLHLGPPQPHYFQQQQQQSLSPQPSGSNKKKSGSSSKKGSVISPADRRPATDSELNFYATQGAVLQGLIAYNMQYLSFFPQSRWLEEFRNAVSSMATDSSNQREHGELKKEHETDEEFLEDFLLEPDNEVEPLMNVAYSNYKFSDPSEAHGSDQRRRSTLRMVSKSATGTGTTPAAESLDQRRIDLEEIMMPALGSELAHEIANLTPFQKSLARFKCREVLGFFRLMLKNRNNTKLNNAQLMENNSRFVVRTILNWGREYLENEGRFNKSQIGKHKRETLFSKESFRAALLQFAQEKGEDISVDNASQFIREYHARMPPPSDGKELPSPPNSRATVHRWLKLLDIKLGPRGKKKGAR